jgi:ABC-type phosphate transport system auxiliary subunit|tara:strand:- start:156 stop:464 length:309 start_codon:yes stop_codon:yes gene_type:complete
MISPALEAFPESLSTVKFANRAKHIKNTARVNEDLDQKSLLRKYERELRRLRQELDERTKNLVDKRYGTFPITTSRLCDFPYETDVSFSHSQGAFAAGRTTT